MDYTQIQYGTNGPIATHPRPERLNTWTPRMSREKWHAIEPANEDPAIGAIVLTGAGRGCCAAADVGGFQDQIEEQEALTVGGDWVELCRRSKPLSSTAERSLAGRRELPPRPGTSRFAMIARHADSHRTPLPPDLRVG